MAKKFTTQITGKDFSSKKFLDFEKELNSRMKIGLTKKQKIKILDREKRKHRKK